jgi:hypothetical protein
LLNCVRLNKIAQNLIPGKSHINYYIKF